MTTTHPTADPTSPDHAWTVDDDGVALAVGLDGRELARYVYRPDDVALESPRPYLHPVRTFDGVAATDFRPADHVWHKGISLALAVVGHHNLWGGPTYVPGEGYVQLDNNGSQEHLTFEEAFAEASGAGVGETLVWRAQDGTELARERRELVFASLPGSLPDSEPDGVGPAWTLTWTSTVRNTSAERLDLGSPTTKGRENAGYGGFFWRAPWVMRDGVVHLDGWSGGDDARGRRSAWASYSGGEPGAEVSVAVVSHQDNPGGVPEWFVRTEEYPCLNPAPFFSTEVPFGPGEELTFRYVLAVLNGALDAAGAAAVTARAALLFG